MEQDNKHPLVAIKCLVFNHESYLRDCLNGFVMQQTDFHFVAIVHDDASTDKSADIIREYATKYPNIIKPIYETENQYSKSDGSLGRVMNSAIDATGAKYVAMCEGDDYWTDPRKLQKQVSFLESHPDYGFVGTRCAVLLNGNLEEENETLGEPIGKEGKWELFGNILPYAVYGPVTRTNTLLYRYDSVVKNRIVRAVGDYSLEALLSSLYGFACLNEACSVYRKHEGGLSNSSSAKYKRMYAEWYRSNRLVVKKEFPKEYTCPEEEIEDGYEYTLLKCAIQEGKYKEALQHRRSIVTPKYRRKTYYKFLLGRLSFAILKIALLFNDRE